MADTPDYTDILGGLGIDPNQPAGTIDNSKLLASLGSGNNLGTLLSLQNQLNQSKSPQEVQADNLNGIGKMFDGNSSFGANMVKGFLAGTAAGKMSNAAQARQAKTDQLNAIIAHQMDNTQKAIAAKDFLDARSAAQSSVIPVLPQLKDAADTAFQTKDASSLSKYVEAMPSLQRFVEMSHHAPDGSQYAGMTVSDNGIHLMFKNPDGSMSISGEPITKESLDANLFAPIANLQKSADLEAKSKMVDIAAKAAGTEKDIASAEKERTDAKNAAMFTPQEGQQGQQTQPNMVNGRNESYLQSLNPAVQNLVKGVANSQVQLTPRALSGYDGKPTPLAMAVMTYDPSFDMGQYPARASLRKDFTSGTTAKNIVSLNTAMSHIDTMGAMAQQLNNGSIKPINALSNIYKDLTGKEAPQDYQTAKTAVASELGKYFRGTGMSDAAAGEWEKAFQSANSPEQMSGVVKTAINLIAGRANELQDQWQKGMGENTAPFQLIDKHPEEVLNKYGYKYQNGRIYSAPQQASGQLDANGIKAAWKAGKIDRATAEEKLKALGYE